MSKSRRRRCGTAARALYATACADLVFIGTAVLTAAPHRRVPATVLAIVAANVLLIAVLICLAKQVRSGRRVVAAIGVIAFLICGHVLAMLLAITRSYFGGPLLLSVHVLFATVLVVTLLLLLRVQLDMDVPSAGQEPEQ
jgi:hypothetical protein